MASSGFASLKKLNRSIIECTRCPELRAYCERIGKEKVKRFKNESYWARPVPGFGVPRPSLWIVGLAPAAHGANRTGRMFTGDRSGEWLYSVLYQMGWSSQKESCHFSDGLKLSKVYISAVLRCAPPQNRPTPSQVGHCSSYLRDEFLLFQKSLKVILCLGSLAFHQVCRLLKKQGHLSSPLKEYVFAHGVCYEWKRGKFLYASYHPSQQNTFTGRLTRVMWEGVFQQIAKRL